MTLVQSDNQTQEPVLDQEPPAARRVEPHVSNANRVRVVVGFPFSSIKIEDADNAAAVADLVARMCRLLAGSAGSEAFADLADEAEALRSQLRR